MATRHRAQTLLIDADDTLWRTLAVFERVIADCFARIDHPTLDAGQLRVILDDLERANIATRGYGTRAFLANLADFFEQLKDRRPDQAEITHLETLAHALLNFEIDLLPGVPETLAELGSRHTLLLVTQGEQAEQQRKIDASGLAHFFARTHIVARKNAAAYTELLGVHRLDPARTWMIGNSPHSDIAPARAAGLNAVHIPHEVTWSLDHAELDPGDDRVLVLSAFPELLNHF